MAGNKTLMIAYSGFDPIGMLLLMDTSGVEEGICNLFGDIKNFFKSRLRRAESPQNVNNDYTSKAAVYKAGYSVEPDRMGCYNNPYLNGPDAVIRDNNYKRYIHTAEDKCKNLIMLEEQRCGLHPHNLSYIEAEIKLIVDNLLISCYTNMLSEHSDYLTCSSINRNNEGILNTCIYLKFCNIADLIKQYRLENANPKPVTAEAEANIVAEVQALRDKMIDTAKAISVEQIEQWNKHHGIFMQTNCRECKQLEQRELLQFNRGNRFYKDTIKRDTVAVVNSNVTTSEADTAVSSLIKHQTQNVFFDDKMIETIKQLTNNQSVSDQATQYER